LERPDDGVGERILDAVEVRAPFRTTKKRKNLYAQKTAIKVLCPKASHRLRLQKSKPLRMLGSALCIFEFSSELNRKQCWSVDRPDVMPSTLIAFYNPIVSI
jgi:hypothetical protein